MPAFAGMTIEASFRYATEVGSYFADGGLSSRLRACSARF
jgi:hypothetical protein